MPSTILVVDDDAPICDFITDLLASEGYQVVRAAHGQAALAYLHQTDTLPSLILLDLVMPLMSGWEFRETQRQDPHLSVVPVVLISAWHELGQGAATLGIPEYIAKPINAEGLLDVVARYCPIEAR
jgi:CheY-like chemotaxis protein